MRIFLLILFYFTFQSLTCSNRSILIRDSEKEFNKLNFHLIGEVKSVDNPEYFNGFGVLNIEVHQTTLEYYDRRNLDSFYYCVIRNNRAQIYQFASRDFKIGDLVELDLSDRELKLLRGDKVQVIDIALNVDERFYKYVRENHSWWIDE